MATDYTEKIASVEEQIERLKHRHHQLAQKHKAEERKARTRRLIERGAIAESLIYGAENMTNEQFKATLENVLRPDQTRQTVGEKSDETEQDASVEGESD